MATPSPHALRTLRVTLGLTQQEAADWVHVTPRAWQWWEAGRRAMPAASWELFVIKAGVHPLYRRAR